MVPQKPSTIAKRKSKITVVGAGLAGSLLSIYLARKGYNVDVYEKRPDMRKIAISAGKSINLALSHRGIYALQQLKIADSILKQSIPMKGRMIHSAKGELSFQPYSRNSSEFLSSVSRRDLNILLMDLGEKEDNVSIHFDHECTGLDFRSGEVSILNLVTKTTRTFRPEILIGSDGSASAIRNSMLSLPRFDFSQSYQPYGYKELIIPANEDGTHQLEKNALHIWPRNLFMLIALPNPDGSFTCTLFLPFEGEISFENLNSGAEVSRFFKKEFPDAVDLLQIEDFYQNPLGQMVTVKCFPWHVKDNVLLLGDAAHAIIPFYGQGINCGFEDCVYLNQTIDKYPEEWERIFVEFEKLRKVNADAISELAVDNFLEMRDKVTNRKFLIKKEAEKLIEAKYPDQFLSTYSRVTFRRDPYVDALRWSRIQDQILEDLCKNLDSAKELDLDHAYNTIMLSWSKRF